jgi:hypothetical protein
MSIKKVGLKLDLLQPNLYVAYKIVRTLRAHPEIDQKLEKGTVPRDEIDLKVIELNRSASD